MNKALGNRGRLSLDQFYACGKHGDPPTPNAQTFRSTDGRLRYTTFADSVLTTNFRPVGTHEESALTHLKYIIRGHVLDETGTPVEGAAIRIGGTSHPH